MGIFEEKHELGGSWDTEESAAPGFLANICAHTQGAPEFYHRCTYLDFPEWVEYGVGFVVAPVAAAVCFRDGDWIGLYSEEHDPTREKTAELVARFIIKIV